MPGVPYDPAGIEAKWQRRWEEREAYRVDDAQPRERCFYVLEMFPYPSGKLHMGHVRNYSIGDAVARYKRMRGFHVLHPMGWDSFGLPAEQAAIERGVHPKEWTYENIDTMRDQLKRMGFSYDWRREFATSDPGYARREQDIFLDLVERGLVYRADATVNWSTGLETVLANEQVVDGKCWRTGTPVVQKRLPQWFLRTTAYAEELLAGLDGLDGWPEAVTVQQRNWIGKSIGAEIDFPLADDPETVMTVFTTRPDTVFGVTFMSIAPEHELVEHIVTDERRAEVEAFRDEVAATPDEERIGEASEKRGVFTGAYAINPVNDERVPIYAANFVLAGYGTGAVMAVPGHDTRDFAFAKRYGIPVVKVIREDGTAPDDELADAFTGVGTMQASGRFDGMRSDAAIEAITAWLAERGIGRPQTTWRLRDWGISRQRYWGNPIPFLYGEESGTVPVRKHDLPVTLPDDIDFAAGGNPLARHPTWATTARDGSSLTVDTTDAREPARRETDTMDTFVESSWYFARYCCHDGSAADDGCAAPLDRRRVDHWLPVDLYVGGIEHAVMHLLYARFFQKALADIGYTGVREPFRRLLCQGMVCMETYSRRQPDGQTRWFYPDEVEIERDAKGAAVRAVAREDGGPVTIGRVEKMSKSLKNTVDPQAILDRYGADTARLFMLFAAPPEKDLDWDESQVAGCYRFLRRLWSLVQDNLDLLRGTEPYAGRAADCAGAVDTALVRKVHATCRRATDSCEQDFAFNTAIAACMELTNQLKPEALAPTVFALGVRTVLRLLAPMAPHVSAELWEAVTGQGDIDAAGWPGYDPDEIASETVAYPVQVGGKVRARIELPAALAGAELERAVREHPEVRALVGDRPLRKLVVVPGKIVNLVV